MGNIAGEFTNSTQRMNSKEGSAEFTIPPFKRSFPSVRMTKYQSGIVILNEGKHLKRFRSR